jgi:hypothetical protein
MFALKLAPKSQPTPAGVILSVASRFFPMPESVSSRFPVGTRSRRISLRIRSVRNASRAANAPFVVKPIGICTYTFRNLTPSKSAVPKSLDLKPFRINTYKKNRRGEGYSRVRRNFAAAACPELRRALRRLPGFPGAPSFAYCAKGGIGSDGTPDGRSQFNFRAATPNARAATPNAKVASYTLSHASKFLRMRTYAKRGRGWGYPRKCEKQSQAGKTGV